MSDTLLQAPQPKLKRRFWQIHLSTAVVMMLAASLLLYLNIVGLSGAPKTIGKYKLKDFSWIEDSRDQVVDLQLVPKTFGWPMSYRREEQMVVVLADGGLSPNTDGPQWSDTPGNIKWNVLFCLAIVAGTAVAIELLTRPRQYSPAQPQP